MGVNIVKYGNQTLIDLTDTTAVASDVAQGKYFYGKDGVKTLGTATGGGGISPTARDLLDYILEHATYTEPNMQEYIDALYIALGGSFTYYTVTNTLSHVTNSNVATQVREELSYTATLTADTDYTIGSVTITMGNVDITSTAYDSATSTITIANVTGDIVITASADISWDVKWDYTMGLPNNNGFTLTNNGGTISLANNGLSVATTNSSSSNVIYKYESLGGLKQEVISELVFEITAFSSQSGSGVRNYASLGGTGATAKKCAELALSQNGIQYLGSASGWSTLSATPLELNTEYTVSIDQTDGNADIYLNGTLVGSITSFREAVGNPQFSVYRGVSALLKSYKLKIIE